jgi:hypothetical protein
MAQFNLEDYETVASRITKLYGLYPDARIITQNLTTELDRAANTWVVRAVIYLSAEDQANELAKSTGMAFEIDGAGMANKTSALENCETSAIGRALANMGLSGDQRASREEMTKVQTGVSPARDWIAEAQTILSVDALRNLYNDARRAGAGQHILNQISDYGKTLEAEAKK